MSEMCAKNGKDGNVRPQSECNPLKIPFIFREEINVRFRGPSHLHSLRISAEDTENCGEIAYCGLGLTLAPSQVSTGF